MLAKAIFRINGYKCGRGPGLFKVAFLNIVFRKPGRIDGHQPLQADDV